MSALPKTPLGKAPEAPDLPPVDELAKGLGRLVKRTQARKLRHTPIDKPIRQAAALAHQRKQGQIQAQQAQAVKANAQAQRAASTAKLVDAVTATRKPKSAPVTPPQSQQAAPEPQSGLGTHRPHHEYKAPPYGFKRRRPDPQEQQDQANAYHDKRRTANNPYLSEEAREQARKEASDIRRMFFSGGDVPAYRASKEPPKHENKDTIEGGPAIPVETERPTLEQLHREAGITPGEGMKRPKPVLRAPAGTVIPPATTPPPMPYRGPVQGHLKGSTARRPPRDASDTGATQTQALPPQTSLPSTPKPTPREPSVSDEGTVIAPQPKPPATPPAMPPQRGQPTPRQALSEKLTGLLREHNWLGFNRVAQRERLKQSLESAETVNDVTQRAPTLDEQLARLKREQGEQGASVAAGAEGVPDMAAQIAANDARITAQARELIAKNAEDDARIRERNAQLAAMSPRQRKKAVEREQAEEMKRRKSRGKEGK